MQWFETVPVCIFPLLETFPNLASLVFFDLSTRVRLQDVHLFAKITQQTALSHLYFSLEGGLIADGPPISGPERLKSLSVEWNVSDGSEPGSSQSHLHEFLRPSLDTFTWLLQLDGCPTVDFQALGPTCTLLCTFKYTTSTQSPAVLKTIAEMFPNITNLTAVFPECVWTVGQLIICRVRWYW